MIKYVLNLKNLFWSIGIIGGSLLLFLGVIILVTPRNQSYPEAVFVGERPYILEIASTKEQRALGLSGRDRLCETCAMLFPFGVPGKYAFWMKNMRFPLDIVWLSSEGVVVHIEHRISQDSQEIYYPKVMASQVLEFNAGILDAVRAGDTLSFFSPQPASF